MQATPHSCSRYWLTFLAAILVCFSTLAQAEAPLAKTQVPGYYRTMLGQFEVTTLLDGVIGLDTKLMKNVNDEDIRRLLGRMFVGGPKMQTAVNAYLINTGSKLVLVDTGAGKLYGPDLGFILKNMAAAGYRPEQIDAVIITHMHGDHIAGLVDANGLPTFPNATIHVSQTENDFWLSPKNEAAAPDRLKRVFVAAHNVSAPYLAQSKWKTFAIGAQLVPGITATAAHGHTPGHTAFSVESQGQKLLIWGDLVHVHAIQFVQPDVAIEFDVDPKQAVVTRRAIFKVAAESKELVAGMHLPFPGIGHVRADGNGTYSWVPVEFSPLK